MNVKSISVITLSAGLFVTGCTTADKDSPASQSAYKAFEQRIEKVANKGDEAVRNLIRTNRETLSGIATQECTEPVGSLAELDCQYDAAGAAYHLAYVSTFDATPMDDEALDPYSTAADRSAAAASSCQSVTVSPGRCAIAAEIGALAPVLAELRDIRMAANDTGLRSFESWDSLSVQFFRAAETIEAKWTEPENLPETGFITKGREGVGCGLVKASVEIVAARNQNIAEERANGPLTPEQEKALNSFYEQSDRAVLALAAEILPEVTDSDDVNRVAITNKCAPTGAAVS